MIGPWELALYAFGALTVLLLIGMPIAFAMILVGIAGVTALIGFQPALALLGQIPVSNTMSYELSVVPMFILMGAFISRSGISGDLYDACNAFVGHRRGGLAIATIMACGAFGAVLRFGHRDGSNDVPRRVPVDAQIRLPRRAGKRLGLRRRHAGDPDPAFGDHGHLWDHDQHRHRQAVHRRHPARARGDRALFDDGAAPGLARSAAGPRGVRVAWPERLRMLRNVGPVVCLFALIMGGLYLGAFTATEAAGVGASGAFVFSLWRGKMTWRDFLDCAIETARITAALFAILIGALLFSQLMNFGGFPRALQTFVTSFGVEPYVVIITICILYIVLGTFFEELSMILLTVPIFFPLVTSLGFDPVWFGIVIVMVVEMGLISPPVGMNLFVVQSILKIPVGTLYSWIMPFMIADIIRLFLIIAFPIIVLILPRLAG